MLSSFHLLSSSYPPFSPVSLSYLCRLHRHHHHFPWQCWLLAMQHLKTVLPSRGLKFKSFYIFPNFLEKWATSPCCVFILLLTFIDKVPMGGRKMGRKSQTLGSSAGKQSLQVYWCRLEVICSPWCYMIFFVASALKFHTYTVLHPQLLVDHIM